MLARLSLIVISSVLCNQRPLPPRFCVIVLTLMLALYSAVLISNQGVTVMLAIDLKHVLPKHRFQPGAPPGLFPDRAFLFQG